MDLVATNYSLSETRDLILQLMTANGKVCESLGYTGKQDRETGKVKESSISFALDVMVHRVLALACFLHFNLVEEVTAILDFDDRKNDRNSRRVSTFFSGLQKYILYELICF